MVFARQTLQGSSLRFAGSNSSLLMTPTWRDCPSATALQTSAGESAPSPDTPRCDVPQDTDEKGVGPRRSPSKVTVTVRSGPPPASIPPAWVGNALSIAAIRAAAAAPTCTVVVFADDGLA